MPIESEELFHSPLPAWPRPTAAVRQSSPSARRPKHEPPRWRLDSVATSPLLAGIWCTAAADCHASHSKRSRRFERRPQCAGQRPPSMSRPVAERRLVVRQEAAHVRPNHRRETISSEKYIYKLAQNQIIRRLEKEAVKIG